MRPFMTAAGDPACRHASKCPVSFLDLAGEFVLILPDEDNLSGEEHGEPDMAVWWPLVVPLVSAGQIRVLFPLLQGLFDRRVIRR